MTTSFTADSLRSVFLEFFTSRGHTLVPSSGLIPSHPAAPLFTNAGMIQFLPYFAGEEKPPYPTATSSQKCVRVRGKHDDIEIIGRTTRHLTFFEMLGNFSFGDYFKEGAIKHAWALLTEVLGLDPDLLWATVHESDDEAALLWHELVGMPSDRIQRLSDDNFWEMGPTGPCGPSSEIFFDKGAGFGAGGGPTRGGEERYVEIWNLVFMTYNRLDDGSLVPLPAQNIDTGAGLERILPILQGTESVFETDVLRSLIGSAEELTGRGYGRDAEDDVSLRIIADHSRAITFLLADGVVPSNEDRGYVLRRIIRRAVRHAQRLGGRRAVLPEMAAAVAAVMRGGYPELGGRLQAVQATLEREEQRFGRTLTAGLTMLESALIAGVTTLPGDAAFKLHDTYGFPIDLTREILAERGVGLDTDGFEKVMQDQRAAARASGRSSDVADLAGLARPVLDEHGATRFVGYDRLSAEARILSVAGLSEERLAVFTDQTPFYPEGGGQVGDTGAIATAEGEGRVVNTVSPLPGVVCHIVVVDSGTLDPGQDARMDVDGARRQAIRRSHTATHLLHMALRKVLGTQLHQQGSLVGADYLRFDFNHHSPASDEELERVEDLVMEQVLSHHDVAVREMSRADADRLGAMSFFGERYGETVRVVTAGPASTELCGGTHVDRLSNIQAFVLTAESSVGSNLRRIEALTGPAALAETRRRGQLLRAAARALNVRIDDVPKAIAKSDTLRREADRERRRLAEQLDRQVVTELTRVAADGVLVQRFDGRDPAGLRSIALAVREQAGLRVVGLVGTPDGESVAIVVAAGPDGPDAAGLAGAAARVVGGGGGGKDGRLAMAGGRDVQNIEAAIDVLRKSITIG